MKIGSLFSGIGGLELGLELAGLGETIWQVEKSKFCRQVLRRHWPQAKIFEDVCSVSASNLEPVDIMCGGFPCQDISVAGLQRGIIEGSRSRLWFEFLRIITEMLPPFVVIENVYSLKNNGLNLVNAGLRELNYDVKNYKISAKAVGAPHRRDRIFILAYDANKSAPAHVRPHGIAERANFRESAIRFYESRMARKFHGFPHGLDGVHTEPRSVENRCENEAARSKMLGNAVVPQCSEVIGHEIIKIICGDES